MAVVWRRGAAAATLGAPHTRGQSGHGLVDFWKLSPVGLVRMTLGSPSSSNIPLPRAPALQEPDSCRAGTGWGEHGGGPAAP